MDKFKAGDRVRMKEDCSSNHKQGDITELMYSYGILQTVKGCQHQDRWEKITSMVKTDLNDIEEGDVLVDPDGDKQIVIGRAGRMVWVRLEATPESARAGFGFSINELIDNGWKFYTEEVKEVFPKIGGWYHFIKLDGKIGYDSWLDSQLDKDCRNFLGIFKTRQEAEARHDLIKNFIKTL